MTLPASIRVNTSFPFPSLVIGSGPITVGKANGIWTVGFSIAILGQVTPLPTQLTTDFVIVYNSLTNTYSKVSLTALGLGGSRNQRSVIATPIVIAAGDQTLNCNIPAPATCALPAASTRNGVPLTFKDLGAIGNNANPIVITALAAVGDTIDGGATLTMTNNRQGVTLVPFNDGVNTGWAIE